MPGIEDVLTDASGGQEWMEIERFFYKKDRHYAKTYLEEQAKYEVLHEETRQGIHACSVQRAACSALDEHLTKLVTEVNQNILAQVQHHRQDRHVAETHREKLAEKAIAEARGLMMEEKESRKVTHKYTEEVTNEICHLYNDLDKATNYRLQKSEKLQEVVQDKLDEIQVAISAEKKIREESTQTMLELFGDMGAKMQKEIDEVKKERKASTDRLLHLMEVVLPHLEQARLNHVKLMHERMEEQKATAALATFAGNMNSRASVKDTIKRKSTSRLSLRGRKSKSDLKLGADDLSQKSSPPTLTHQSINAMLPVLATTQEQALPPPELKADENTKKGGEMDASTVDESRKDSSKADDKGGGVSLPSIQHT